MDHLFTLESYVSATVHFTLWTKTRMKSEGESERGEWEVSS
jgi:hypothetical protein